MMADIVNLRLQRKRKARAVKESEATANRAKFGTPKGERKLAQAKRDREEKHLDDHEIEK
ncbi:MAG: DUF4169 family protein [Rhizobiales bacterium]|nr:DUF4169 family protein [Hyphomicrobiales bacterium]